MDTVDFDVSTSRQSTLPDSNNEGTPVAFQQALQSADAGAAGNAAVPLAAEQTKSASSPKSSGQAADSRPAGSQKADANTSDTATPAARAAGEYSKKIHKDVLHTGHGFGQDRLPSGGYAYQDHHYIADPHGKVTPEQLMKFFMENPNAVFPFHVTTQDGKPGAIVPGAILDLRGPRTFFAHGLLDFLDKGNLVQVESVSPTQFTFRTLNGHFDGPDNLISFRIYEEGGKIYLEQTAWAPHAKWGRVAPEGAHWAWGVQADNLRKAAGTLAHSQ